jgi:DNA-binding IscR family transcriptional regulator
MSLRKIVKEELSGSVARAAEYSETNPEHVVKLLRDLEKAKLVEIS